MKYLFDKNWFKENQKLLLKIVNSWIGKLFFKLNRNSSSVGNNPIIEIAPHFITWKNKDSFSTEFRTHNKFSKRIFYGLYPIWYVFHLWDTLFANRFYPDFNLGFDTLTVYPDADPETTTVDGDVFRATVVETFSTIRSGAGNAFRNETTIIHRLVAHNTESNYTSLVRGIHLFDTSTLSSNAVLSSAVLSLYGVGKSNGLGLSTAHRALSLVESSPASNTTLVNSDYGTLGTTRYADDFAYDNFSTTGYNDITLNSTGLSNISLTGITKFGTRLAVDTDNGTPAWVTIESTSITIRSSDYPNGTFGPKLLVTYNLTNRFFLMF